MTRKHFETIANAIRVSFNNCEQGTEAGRNQRAGIHIALSNLTAELARLNPNFDRARFLKACGVVANSDFNENNTLTEAKVQQAFESQATFRRDRSASPAGQYVREHLNIQ